jgi:hypothetical protein
MSMHGSTIRLLEAAQFSTPQAVAIAEAIDSGLQSAELVTVPVFEARMAQSEARSDAKLAQLELRLLGKMDERFSKVDEKFAKLNDKFSALCWRMLGLGVTGIGVLVGISHFWPPAR